MPELTAGQIADLRALRDHCVALGADLVIIGAIAYQVHSPVNSGIQETSTLPWDWISMSLRN